MSKNKYSTESVIEEIAKEKSEKNKKRRSLKVKPESKVKNKGNKKKFLVNVSETQLKTYEIYATNAKEAEILFDEDPDSASLVGDDYDVDECTVLSVKKA